MLFGDGSVQWFRTRNGGPLDADIFLNDHLQPRPGMRTCMTLSWCRPRCRSTVSEIGLLAG